MDLKLTKDNNYSNYNMDSDTDSIEKSLKRDFSNKRDNYRVQKQQVRQLPNNRVEMDKKIELSSNKEIDIGLDLLINPEKKTKVENDDKNLVNVNDVNAKSSDKRSTYNLENDKDDIDDFDALLEQSEDRNTKNLMDKLNIDKGSHLSQEEIDSYIDRKDSEQRRKPKLVDENEIEDLLENDKRYSKEYKNPEDFEDGEEIPEEYLDQYEDGYNSSAYGSEQATPRDGHREVAKVDPNAERREKEEVLYELEKLRRHNVQGVKRFNMSSDLDEMKYELKRVKTQRTLDKSIKFQRTALITVANGVEKLNKSFNLFDFRLDGWADHVEDTVDEYNEVFEELHELYGEKMSVHPLLKLLYMVGGSAFMFHITNKFSQEIPGIETIMKNNPELMKQFANAAINSVGGQKAAGMSNMFNQYSQMSSGQSQGRPMTPPGNYGRTPEGMTGFQSQPMSYPQQTQGRPPMPSSQRPPQMAPQQSPRMPQTPPTNKITAPVGVDDILNDLKSNSELGETFSMSSKSIGGTSRNKRIPKRTISLNLGR
jgi:hypothetical protein